MSADLMALLQQQLGGASPSEAVAQLTADDPQLAQIVQLLTGREQQLQAELQQQEQDELEEQLREREEQARQARGQALRRHLDELTGDVRRLQDTIDLVAAALGACPTCLGRDEACPLCHGRGRVGSMPPDPVAFDRVVLPAVRAHAYSRSRTARARTEPESPERSAT